jgi:hypothetical protein
MEKLGRIERVDLRSIWTSEEPAGLSVEKGYSIMPILFNSLLRQAGLSLRNVRLLRHQDNRADEGNARTRASGALAAPARRLLHAGDRELESTAHSSLLPGSSRP